MVKKLKKILALTLIATIVPTFAVYATTNWLSLFAKGLWKVAVAGSNQFYNVSPNIEEQCGWVRSSTGTIDFNSSTFGASTILDANLGKSNLNLDVFATIDPLNWFETISVIVTNPNGTDVINRSVTHNQHSFYNSAAPYGIYKIRFVENDKKKWNCYSALTDWDVACGASYASDQAGNVKEYVTDSSTKKTYFVPSLTHKTLTRSVLNRELSLSQLRGQFFDEGVHEYVNNTKDFNVGDLVYVTAPLDQISYDSKTNSTKLFFKCDDDIIQWPFAGDLTEKYKVGNPITFKFQVVKEYEGGGHIFENINYFVDGAAALVNGGYVDIAQYLR